MANNPRWEICFLKLFEQYIDFSEQSESNIETLIRSKIETRVWVTWIGAKLWTILKSFKFLLWFYVFFL
jgi:hypothetical protein